VYSQSLIYFDWLLKIIYTIIFSKNQLSNLCMRREANIMSDKTNILYLFDRPTEPIFMGKGDGNVSFDLPADYLVS